mgnify:FL=1|jgi:hypothetical protein
MKLIRLFQTLLPFLMITFFLCGCGQNDWLTSDKVEILSEFKSPNGDYIATIFSCAGGGAAGYTYTNVNLRKKSQDFSQRDFLLGEHLWHSFSEISVDWKDSRTLNVSYRWVSDNSSHKIQNGKTVPEKDGVKVNYSLHESSQ